MDLLRSCYKGTMRYVDGDPTQKTTVKWFFCKPTAKPFPVPHAFGSQNWDSVHPTATDLGDDAASPRPYYNGRALNSSKGTDFAGPIEYFQDGQPSGTQPLPRGVIGTPVDCLNPPYGLAKGGLCVPALPAIGGVYKSGKAIAPTFPCFSCPAGTPGTLVVNLVGATGPQAMWNGVNVLPQQDALHPCNYQIVSGPDGIFANWFLTANVNVTFVAGGNSAAYVGAFADCTTAGVLTFAGQIGGGTWPPTIGFTPV